MEFSGISRVGFRKRLIAHLLWQGLTVGVTLYYFNLGNQQARADWQLYALVALLVLQPVGYVIARIGGFWPARFIPERIKTIYPWLEMPAPKWFIYFWASPIATLGLLFYLWNKAEVQLDQSPPLAFRHLKITAILVYISSLLPISYQVHHTIFRDPGEETAQLSSKLSYWMSGPVVYYLSTLIEESQNLEKIAGRFREQGALSAPSEAVNPITDFTELSRHQAPSTTGLLLMTATSVTYNMKQKKRLENSSPSVARQYNLNLQLIEDLAAITTLGDQGQPQILKYNPVSFFTQSARMGIISTGLFSLISDLKYQSTLLPRMEEMMKKATESLPQSGLSEEEKKSVLSRVEACRTKVESARQHLLWQSIIALKWFKGIAKYL